MSFSPLYLTDTIVKTLEKTLMINNHRVRMQRAPLKTDFKVNCNRSSGTFLTIKLVGLAQYVREVTEQFCPPVPQVMSVLERMRHRELRLDLLASNSPGKLKKRYAARTHVNNTTY